MMILFMLTSTHCYKKVVLFIGNENYENWLAVDKVVTIIKVLPLLWDTINRIINT